MNDLRNGEMSALESAPDTQLAKPKLQTAEIAGFWRRLVALWLDMLLLAVAGAVIGSMAFRPLVALGQEGRLIGAAITLCYFGIFNTGFGRGTFGKRVMGLRVIERSGKNIGLFRSLLRTIVFWTPYYLNGVFFTKVAILGLPDNPNIALAAGILDTVVVFGGMGLIVYLYLFNTRTRQSLHDLIAGTYVVRAETVGLSMLARFWRPHLAIAAIVTLLVVTVPLTFSAYMLRTSLGVTLKNAVALQSAVLAYPGVATATVSVNTFQSVTTSSTATRTTLIVGVSMRDVPELISDAQNGIAAIVLQHAPTILGQQYLGVSVSYGYDLGIWKWTNTGNWIGTLLQWRQRLGGRDNGVKA